MPDYLSNESFNDREILSYEKIVETLDAMVRMGIPSVQYTGGGEPLVHPRIKDIFKETFRRGIELSLVSNGQALDEELCEMLSQSIWTRISVDSGSDQLYSLIRNVSKSKFNIVLNNIRTLVKYKKENIIGVGFVVEKENYKEVFEAAKIFKDIGVDNFRISAAFTPLGYKYFDNFIREAKELCLKAQELSDTKFTVFNLFTDRVKDTFEGTQDYSFCPIKDLLTYIGADYNVYTCCTHAYNKLGLIGSIKDTNFENLWLSQEKLDIFSKHDPRKVCQHPCMYKGKNEFINYCIKTNPKHVNFI
jgi:MoaA/NifB/PqqE/SkfB family radical SAM enzyme